MNLSYQDSTTARQYKHEENPHWLGKKAGYTAFHAWLSRNFGSPKSCEQCEAPGLKEKDGRWSIQYALKTGKEHDHVRSNYFVLCRSCHRKYDMTDKERNRLKEMASNQSPEQLKRLSVIRKKIASQRKRDSKGHFIRALNPKKV